LLHRAKDTIGIISSTILSFFSGVSQPCIRAEMSKLVNKEEQGALFAILASLESLCNFSSQLIFIPLYTWTVTKLKGEYVGGITFFINASLLLIPVVLIGIIQCHKPQSKRKEFSPLLDNENPVSWLSFTVYIANATRRLMRKDSFSSLAFLYVTVGLNYLLNKIDWY